MAQDILGLHHITAIAGDAQRNYDFYTQVLELRLVKKTVNFDDPQTYHFYFGDRVGTPGTILTFFPWTRVKPGQNGAGMATEIGYSVPVGSLEFWSNRFKERNVPYKEVTERMGEKMLQFTDPDGLVINLIEVEGDDREGWQTADIGVDKALRGFHTVTLTLRSVEATADLLVDLFGYRKVGEENGFHRYQTDAISQAAFVDLLHDPDAPRGIHAGGTNHHVAFRVKDDQVLMQVRQRVLDRGWHITEKIDRDYFYSLYFREPGGVLFEIATDNPGFDVDESVEELGGTLQLPTQYEPFRERIEKALPQLVQA